MSELEQLVQSASDLGYKEYTPLSPIAGYAPEQQNEVLANIKQLMRSDDDKVMMRTEMRGDTKVMYMYGPITSSGYYGITADLFMDEMPEDLSMPVEIVVCTPCILDR